MEVLVFLVVFIGLIYGIYRWAESKGRNGTLWALLAVLISPLFSAIILAFVPKTLEKQAEETKKLKELINN